MVRPATNADLSAVVDLCHALHAETAWTVLKFDEGVVYAKLWELLQQPERAVIFVSEVEGQITGTLAVTLDQSMFGIDVVATEIFWYVKPEFRGSSDSVRLVRVAGAWATTQGATVLLMAAQSSSPPSLRKFYAREGYTEAQFTYIKRLT